MKQIEVDALKEKLDKIPARSIENADGRAYVLIRLSTVFEIIKQMPSAQPGRKMGHWIRVAGMNECCSACNKYFPLSYFTGRPFDINYCPNCGADMRGEPIERI